MSKDGLWKRLRVKSSLCDLNWNGATSKLEGVNTQVFLGFLGNFKCQSEGCQN